MTQAHSDKLYDHHRQQLSAMLDGELPPDEAKFMLRRLEHDGELAACWERWQVCGDILRGRHDALLPADFSGRVVAAIASGERPVVIPSGAQAPARRSRFARWTSGAAIAASVAIAALFVVRQPSTETREPVTQDDSTQMLASSPSTTLSEADGLQPAQRKDPPSGVPDTAVALASAAAVASVPRRGTDRSSRSQAQRAGVKLRQRDDRVPAIAVARNAPSHAIAEPPAAGASLASQSASAAYDPFAAQPVAVARPWPRAILPAYQASGAFTARYDASGAAGSAFHPFEPRVEARADARIESSRAEKADATPMGPR